MIVIKLVGGLASQLHKYAVAKSIAERYSKKLKVDLSVYQNMEESNALYYVLPNIGIYPSVASEQDLLDAKKLTILGDFIYFFNRLLGQKKYLVRISKKILYKIESTNFCRFLVFKNFLMIHISNSGSLEWIDKIDEMDSCYIDAEFGLRFDIIENMRNELKENIAKTNISNRAQNYLDQIRESSISVSMHVRRGDYVTNKTTNKFHGICGEEYYKKAVERYKDFENTRFFVFSDDLDWVKKEYKSFLPENTVFVSSNKNYEDFFLMMNCSNHIIANSGFSSMSAWLSHVHESNITSPARWFVHEETNRNQLELLPKGWVYL